MGNYMYYLMRDEEFVIGLVSMLGSLLSIVYLLPLMQALYNYEKKNWLLAQFAKGGSSSNLDDTTKRNLLAAAEPSQSHPIYKIFKFYFASTGIIGIIIGLLIMVLPSDLGPDSINWLLFLPLIFGGGIYFIYITMFNGEGLWREIAAVSAFVGFATTTLIAYGNFEMYDWLRSDILAYLILAVGFFLIIHLKATLLSYIYMICVAVAGFAASMVTGYKWLMFLSHFVWIFAIAILYIWVPKLRETKDIGVSEILFGIFFTVMMLSLAVSRTSGLVLPALAIVLPGLYIFSKAYYKKANSIFGKPIEIFVILIVISMATAMSVNEIMTAASDSIYLFKYFSFHKLIAYVIIAGLGYGAFYIYDNDMNDNDTKTINPFVALFPVGAFLIAYVLGEYGGHYIMTAFLIVLGYVYMKKGLDLHDEIRVAIGTNILVITIMIKLIDILQTTIMESVMKGEKFIIGFLVFFFGALFLGSVVYIRSQWSVSGPDDNNGNDDLLTSENNTIIDNIPVEGGENKDVSPSKDDTVTKTSERSISIGFGGFTLFTYRY